MCIWGVAGIDKCSFALIFKEISLLESNLTQPAPFYKYGHLDGQANS